MAFLSRLLRSKNPLEFRLTSLHLRHFSSILSPDSKTPLSTKEKSRAALSLLKSEKNPEKIIDICRAASLTPESHLDRIAFSVAIDKLTKSNYFEGIRLFIEELKTRPDLRNERFISHAIVLYGQASLVDNAIKTFETMHELGVDQTVKSLNALLFSCVVARKYSEVRRIFLEFPRKYGIEANLDTYNTVVKAFCESCSSNSVYSILAEMERKRVKPNMSTFGFWIAGFYKEEKFDEVGKVLEFMKKHEMTPGLSIYNIRIQSLCKLKRSVEAKALLDLMISRGMKPNSETYTHLIHGFCKEGNLDDAKKLFDEMPRKGFKPDADCYFTLVHFLVQGEDFEAALRVCKECMAKGWVPNYSTMKRLVDGLSSGSKVDEAKELVVQIKEKFPKSAHLWSETEESLTK